MSMPKHSTQWHSGHVGSIPKYQTHSPLAAALPPASHGCPQRLFLLLLLASFFPCFFLFFRARALIRGNRSNSAFFPVSSAFFPVCLPFFRCYPHLCQEKTWQIYIFLPRLFMAERPEGRQKWDKLHAKRVKPTCRTPTIVRLESAGSR